jgi:hypothetical protein
MLHLIQLITYMLNRLEYTEAEVVEVFESLESPNSVLTIDQFFSVVGLKTPTDRQVERMVKNFPKWRSALKVVVMQLSDSTYQFDNETEEEHND